jgi:hypothetical protein
MQEDGNPQQLCCGNHKKPRMPISLKVRKDFFKIKFKPEYVEEYRVVQC